MATQFFKRHLHLLHLEDNKNDQVLVSEMLRADGLLFEVVAVTTRGDFEGALRQKKYDLIISDFSIPSYDGSSALAVARQVSPQTPFIFFSGTIGEEVAVDSLKHGAVDYILKQRPHRLIPAIRSALQNIEERIRLRKAEEKIREQIEFLDKAQDAILVMDLEGSIIYWNKGAERIYGWSAEDAIGKPLADLIFRGISEPQLDEVLKDVNERGEWVGELREMTKADKVIVVQGRCNLIRDGQNRPKSYLLINTDITERKHLEEQILRGQRLQSLGALVSGIAHDLNNMLVPIIVGVDILRAEKISEDAEFMLQTMEGSARRSADMVRQMLAFARGDASKAIINPGQLVKEMSKFISETFPKSIHCLARVEKSSWSISGLPTQMHQVLLNLCVNARDAMPNGGTLTLATENVKISLEEAALRKDIKPGNYLCLSVSDTGHGISAEQIEKIFQPFFTTKAPGKGTGLGLSTCQSIAKSHNGFITVQSKINSGTEFKVYFPASNVESLEEAVLHKTPLPAGKGECILVVDDEEGLLAITRAALENYGYNVLTATSGFEAVVQFTKNPDAVNLVITDLAMPFMDGFETIAALRKIRPEIKIIIASGSEKEVEEAKDRIVINSFVAKPFTNDELIETVHEVLSRKK
ncbi:MAG TPA: response regulator [Verrucomicrobiae bacterium]|jgi:PAS domain S-box-containing protein|nr:response regulator [Verrucomicrobiae bacterium]